MVNTIIYKYDKARDIYTFYGYFGLSISYSLERILTKAKVNSLFIKITAYELSIYSFFLLELEYLLNTVLKTSGTLRIPRTNYVALMSVLKHIEEIKKNITVKKETIDYEKISNEFRYTILDYQKEAFTRYIDITSNIYKRGYLLDAATGTGKTFMSTALAVGLNSDIIIIIAPKIIVQKVWLHALTDIHSKEFIFKQPKKVYCVLKDINVNEYISNVYENQNYIVTSYENIDKLFDLVPNFKNMKTAVIVDEWHNFSNKESNRTVKLAKLLDMINCNHTILMSGTPIKAVATELVTLYTMLDKRFNSDVEKRFYNLYKNPNDFIKTILPIRYAEYTAKINKSELDLNPVINIYLNIELPNGKEYILENIKEKLIVYIKDRLEYYNNNFNKYENRYLELYNKAKNIGINIKNIDPKLYNNYEKDIEDIKKYYKKKVLMYYPDLLKRVNNFEKDYIIAFLEDKIDKNDFIECKTIVKYLLYKIQGEALANVILRERINCYVDLAKNIDYKTIIESSKKKVILFSKFIEVCDAAVNTATNNKIKNIAAYNTNKLNQLVDTFKSTDIPLLISTYASLSTGVPITEANTVIIVDPPYRKYVYDQAIARVWRLGQNEQVYVYLIKLDTGDQLNIVDRGFDIIEFFTKTVEEVTGYKFELTLDETFKNKKSDIEENITTENIKIDIFSIYSKPIIIHPYAKELWDNILNPDYDILKFTIEEKTIDIDKLYSWANLI